MPRPAHQAGRGWGPPLPSRAAIRHPNLPRFYAGRRGGGALCSLSLPCGGRHPPPRRGAEGTPFPAERGRIGAAHPFAAAAPALLDAVAPAEADVVDLPVRLPTRAGVPQDSPELLRDDVPERIRGAVSLADWRVPALHLSPDE